MLGAVHNHAHEVVVPEHLLRWLSRRTRWLSGGCGGTSVSSGAGGVAGAAAHTATGAAGDGSGAAVRVGGLLRERARLQHEHCVADLVGNEGDAGRAPLEIADGTIAQQHNTIYEPPTAASKQ